ncbi:hypothetical protein APHAL10511_004731 [Amanita phalloides]|nr:hypothetical protein APHAL10511_004731 [Amanita phalloides]
MAPVRESSSDGKKDVPGVQKIKTSLRQTRRLLAKDNLAADVRVVTERRLKALEADLQRAELARKERALAVRYHKIKFFERQKVVRKLNQTKKQLASGKEEASELKAALYELRVDLNYILNYPKTKKYISLFPPEVRRGVPGSARDETGSRDEIRKWIRERMEAGELAVAAEEKLDRNKT